jgi:hypothetical protein
MYRPYSVRIHTTYKHVNANQVDSEEVLAAQRKVEAVIQRVGQGVKGAVQGAVSGAKGEGRGTG